jgi:hypothetical protein
MLAGRLSKGLIFCAIEALNQRRTIVRRLVIHICSNHMYRALTNMQMLTNGSSLQISKIPKQKTVHSNPTRNFDFSIQPFASAYSK